MLTTVKGAVEIGVGALALTAALFGLGVAVRFCAFALHPALRANTFLAGTYPTPDLTLLGATVVLSFSMVLFAGVLLISIPAMRGIRAHLAAAQRVVLAGERLKRAHATGENAMAEVAREVFQMKPKVSRLEASRERLEAAGQQMSAAFHSYETAFDDLEAMPNPYAGRTYPIEALGIRFSSRRIFVLLAAMVTAALFGLAVLRDFPAAFVQQLCLYVGFVMMLRTTMSRAFSLVALAAAGLIVLAGAMFASVLTFRLAVGFYEWHDQALPNGRYALAAKSESTVYVIRCGNTASGTIAVPAAVVARVTYVPSTPVTTGPSLLDIFTVPGTFVMFSPLDSC